MNTHKKGSTVAAQKNPQFVLVSQEQLDLVKTEMAILKGMMQHFKTIVRDLKETIALDALEKNRISTDSGMSSESVPNKDANTTEDVTMTANDSNQNHTLTETVTPKTVTATDVVKPVPNTDVSIRPIKPLLYGIIRHNPNRVSTRKTLADDTPIVKVEKETKEQNLKTPKKCEKYDATAETPITYLHKKKRAANGMFGSNASENMVPIGSGKTFVPESVYAKINWNSYTIATRKLLVAVFSRKTLASHCLTGKKSPAFANKPAKLCLDQRKVADIILTVTDKCKVKECLVRNAITTKCADENKMLRMREKRLMNMTFTILETK